MTSSPLLLLENDQVQLALAADCSGRLTDRASAARWEFHPVALQETGPIMTDVVWNRFDRSFCDYYAGRFRAEAIGPDASTARTTTAGATTASRPTTTACALRVTVLAPPFDEPRGAFTCRVRLDGPWVEFRLEDIDESLPSLVFPPHLQSDSLVLPTGVGQWVRRPSGGTRFHVQATHLNMRWFGGLAADTDHGWMAVFEDGYADSGGYQNGLAIAPAWLQSLGRWSSTRSIRYRCTTGGYVGQAKTFRRYAQEHGLIRPLREKIAECPAVGDLLGGRILSFFMGSTPHRRNFEDTLQAVPADVAAHDGRIRPEMTFADVARVIAEAQALGMRRGACNVRGVWRGGYDEFHPDIWPPETAYGSIEELRALVGQASPFLCVLHDNYQDAYPRAASFPKGVIRLSDGSLMPGGFWHGGQCYIQNPRSAVDYVRRNWERQVTLSPRGVFCDTMSCVQFYQDWNPENLLTRTQDWQAKTEMMRFYKERGMALGSENASDFGMAHLDFLENRHENRHGESIPLWPLVYHDAAYCARYPAGGTSGGAVGRLLDEILWGYLLMWPGTKAGLAGQAEAFRASLAVDAWHARIGLDEMVGHRYLSEDSLVERTEFSSGAAVAVNYADEPRTVEGRTIPAQGHLILD